MRFVRQLMPTICNAFLRTTVAQRTPTKKHGRRLTSQQLADVCSLLTLGCSRTSAAGLLGVDPNSINTDGRPRRIAQQIAKAESRRELGYLTTLQQAATKDWRAAAWALERLNPDLFGRRKPEAISPAALAAAVRKLALRIDARITDETARAEVVAALTDLLAELQFEPA